MVGLSICHSSEPFNNGSTDRHAVWVEDSSGPKESCTVIFGFSIRTSPQRRSILLCENAKTELIYFNGSFRQSISTDHAKCEGLFFTLGVVNSFTLGVVGLSVNLSHHTHTPQPFYGPFSGTTRVSWCQKRTSGLYGAREDKQRQTHRQSGWVPFHPD